MPKRTVTPPPADDEPRYLTVVHPYPLHAHMELPKDREDFGRWVACCIGPDPFYAFFYKPSALNMVIVEVRRDYDGFDRLLGEHRWKEFLRNPSEEEQEKVTKVYYCVYNSGRQVQKNGWKRVDPQENWFRNFRPNNNLITYPYPATHYCDLPPEDTTNHPLCRPLPSARFPPPQAPVQTVVRPPPPGSAGWVTQKASPKPPPTRGAWGGRPPTALHIPASTRGSKSPVSAKATTSPAKSSPWNRSSTSASPSVPNSATGRNNAWSRAPSSSISSATSSATSPTSGSSGVSEPSLPSPSSEMTLPFPPGLGPLPPGISTTSWADDIPDGLFPQITVNNAQSTLPSLGGNPASLPIISGHPNGIIDSMEDAFTELGIVDPTAGYASMWECTDSSDVNVEMSTAVSATDLWADYVEEKPVVQELLCTDHGRICKRGICKTYAKLLREEERAKRMANNPNGDNGRGRGRGKNRGGARNGGSHHDRDAGSRNGGRERDRLGASGASGGWRKGGGGVVGNSNSNSSGTSTPLNASSPDDEDKSSVVSKRGRSRANSIDSSAPSEASTANGWGAFSQGPWGPT